MKGKKQFRQAGVKKGKLSYTLLLVESFPSVFYIKGFKENVGSSSVVLRRNWKEQLFRNRFNSKIVVPTSKHGAVRSYADMVKEKQVVYAKQESSIEAGLNHEIVKSSSIKEREQRAKLTEVVDKRMKCSEKDAVNPNDTHEETSSTIAFYEKHNVCEKSVGEKHSDYLKSKEKHALETNSINSIDFCKEILEANNFSEDVINTESTANESSLVTFSEETKSSGGSLDNNHRIPENVFLATDKIDDAFTEGVQDLTTTVSRKHEDSKTATVCFLEKQTIPTEGTGKSLPFPDDKKANNKNIPYGLCNFQWNQKESEICDMPTDSSKTQNVTRYLAPVGMYSGEVACER